MEQYFGNLKDWGGFSQFDFGFEFWGLYGGETEAVEALTAFRRLDQPMDQFGG